MFLALLRVQWRWCRAVVLPAALLLGALPFLVLREIDPRMLPYEVMLVVGGWGPIFPALAALLGLLIAFGTWSPDRTGLHIHALSLPIPRWRYVLYRFLGGVLLLAPVFLFLLIGAVVATRAAPIPAGLQAYPWSLALRFALASLLAYALFFAILSGTPRTAAMILAGCAGLVALSLLAAVLLPHAGVGDDLFYLVLHGLGPFGLFAGRWVLLDV